MSAYEERTQLPNGWTLRRLSNYWGKSPAWVVMKLNPDGFHSGYEGPFARRRDAVAAAKVKP